MHKLDNIYVVTMTFISVCIFRASDHSLIISVIIEKWETHAYL